MENNKENIVALREKLRNCYKFLHKDDEKKLGYLNSKKTSESNPFFNSLSLDLEERFGKDTSGISKYTIRDLYSKDDKNYAKDTLTNLGLFCDEIEKKIEREKQLDQENIFEPPQFDKGAQQSNFVISSFLNIKKGSFFQKYRTLIAYFFASFSVPILFVFLIFFANQDNAIALGVILQILWFISAIVTVFGIYYTIKYAKATSVIISRLIVYFIGILVSVLMILYIIVGTNYIADELRGIPNELPNLNSAFVFDPARLGNGNTSISFDYNVSNQSDELDLGGMADRDTLTFFVFIDYQNAANEMLKNVKTSIKFPKKGYSSKASIFGMLSTSTQKESLIDKTYLINLPNSWSLSLVDAHCTNTHSQEECPGYAYNIPLELGEVVSSYGASLPNLDTYGVSKRNGITGACSQGHVVAQFQLINTSGLR